MQMKVKDNYRYLIKFTLIYLFIQFLVRAIFLAERPPGFIAFVDTVLGGAAWDIGTWLVLSLPLFFISSLFSTERHKVIFDSKFNHFLTFGFCFVISAVGMSEVIFWNEFHSRFNFIAVDYLIYTNEVLRNLRESYPMVLIFSALIVFSLAMTYGFSKIKFKTSNASSYFKMPVTLLLGCIFPMIFVLGISPWLEMHNDNFHEDQMSRNGLFEFVRAFSSNKIEYTAFYKTLPDDKVNNFIMSTQVPHVNSSVKLPVKKPNVVMIVVESLGAKFIGPLSTNQESTPYLNKLAKESLFFTNFYATGTRTVRGIEALTLSIPPTPGYAVVKRPDHKNLYSMGHTFKSNGYDPIFLYGGRGFFDNMNAFFSGNEFRVFDQSDFKEEQTTFSNAWGVCDEDLFNKAEQFAQSDTTRPFLMFLLTTSNHRPFTYPDGKIDIQSGTSRAGAVKYTDYAIGKFLENVKDKEWAKNTIFVVVADHSTEGRGQFDLEMKDFHIPLWIYAPSYIKPQIITKLGSQIDLLPTLIHLLDLKDNSPFFGKSFFNEQWKEERAFIGNYQYVGHYKNKVLTTLGPNQMNRNYSYDPMTKEQSSMGESPYTDEAISYYQKASRMLDNGEYKYTSTSDAP